jgi:2-amino-4-hydroxy-6-hydroxymethyldihydropteridine diphosphokinase
MTSPTPARAYVGLGGNLGDVRTILAAALEALDQIPQTNLRQHSKLYRTPAWGKTDQPSFLNAAAELQTQLPPRALLEQLLSIEQRFGRSRDQDEKWGPRSLDLDLLAYEQQVLDEPGLHLPHPHLHQRAFVLVPLAEIAGDFPVPGQGRVSDLLAAVDSSAIEALD